MGLRTILILAALAVLSACNAVRSGPEVPAQAAAPPPPVDSAPPPSAQAPPPPPAAPPPPTPAPPAPTAALPPPSADQLLGLDAQGVTRLLGPPGLKRTEGPAHVWQYANRLCVLDVVMYEEEGKREARVSYVELRDPTGGSAVPRNCFRSFLRTPPDGGA